MEKKSTEVLISQNKGKESENTWKKSTEVQISQNKGKESENTYQNLKRSL